MKKPPAKKPQNSRTEQTTISVRSQEWHGPLPPPAILEDFDNVVPNGAERIVKAWEDETRHRREIEVQEQRSFYRDMLVGKIFALIFVLAALGTAAFAAYVGAEWLGAILGAGTIGAVVWAFVRSQQRDK